MANLFPTVAARELAALRRLGVLLIMCVLPVTCVAQSSTTPKPDSGDFANSSYSNDYFGFTYKLNDGWYLNKELMNEDAQRPKKFAGRFLLLIVDRHTGNPTRERVLMTADDASMYHPGFDGAKDYVTKLVNAMLKGQGMESVRDAFPVEYGGKLFYRGNFNERYPGGALHKSFVATERGGFLLSWTFVASSAEQLDHLVNSLAEITFASVVPGLHLPAATESTSAKRVRISQVVLEALILEKPLPPYPDAARKNKIQGLVRLHVLISRTGELKKAELLDGGPLLGQAALDGVRYWKFKPYLLNGEPVEVDSQITIDFKLPKNSKPS